MKKSATESARTVVSTSALTSAERGWPVFEVSTVSREGLRELTFGLWEMVAAYRAAKRLESDHSVIRDRPWASASVQLQEYAAVKDLCQYFGVSDEEFRRLNPSLRPPVLEGKKYIPKGVALHLPATHFIRERIRTMPDSLFHSNQFVDSRPETTRKTQRAHEQTYTVRRGETALAIARRFGISLDTLRRANQLGKKAEVRIGQRLTIPGSSSSGRKKGLIKSKAKRKP